MIKRSVNGLIVLLLKFSCIVAYSKVSRYGQARSNVDNVAFTLSPLFAVTQRTTNVDLRPGEAVNHPSTLRYSTIDEQLLSHLDATSSLSRNKPQERFHPPASFEHVISHTRLQNSATNPLTKPSSSSRDVVYQKPVVSMSYDDFSTNFGSSDTPDKPTIVTKDSFPSYAAPFPDTFPTKPITNNVAKKPTDSLIFGNAKPPIYPDEHYYPSYHDDADIVYEHPSHHHYHNDDDDDDDDDYHHYHHHHHHHQDRPKTKTTTTMEPEPMDQRLNRRPYSYYNIGKKLWYVPLYFSIYFIIYIAALVLKSIARHKINFPTNLAAAAGNGNIDGRSYGWMDYANFALDAIENRGR